MTITVNDYEVNLKDCIVVSPITNYSKEITSFFIVVQKSIYLYFIYLSYETNITIHERDFNNRFYFKTKDELQQLRDKIISVLNTSDKTK